MQSNYCGFSWIRWGKKREKKWMDVYLILRSFSRNMRIWVDVDGVGSGRGFLKRMTKDRNHFRPCFFNLLIKFDKTGWTLNGT